MKSKAFFMAIHCIVVCTPSIAQQQHFQQIDSVLQLPGSYFNEVQKKYSAADRKLTQQTDKYIATLEKIDKRVQRKLARMSGKVFSKIAGADGQYEQLRNKIQQGATREMSATSGTYLPMMDSVKGSLSFLSQHATLLKGAKEKEKVLGSLERLNQLQGKLQCTDQLKGLIAARKEQLSQYILQLGAKGNAYTSLYKSLSQDMAAYQKQAYYYSTQVAAYKAMLNEPDRLITKGLAVLRKIPAFTAFMKTHGQLAGLFGLPIDYGTSGTVAGLQTRAQTQALITSQI